ncbi:hypothetical protein GQ54DRAFT_94996 [Martensiomyces pterosporus]|nr:hypothetical protein GQ54DRAFT_94996 [Martensiomyces pterosporus]
MQPWENQQGQNNQQRQRNTGFGERGQNHWRPNRPPPVPPFANARPPPPHLAPQFAPTQQQQHQLRPPLPPPLPPPTVEEQQIIDKMAEAYNRNPAVVDMVRQTQGDTPKYRFLNADSPLHSYFLWRVSLQRSSNNGPALPPAFPRPPPPLPLSNSNPQSSSVIAPPGIPPPHPPFRHPPPPPLPPRPHMRPPIPPIPLGASRPPIPPLSRPPELLPGLQPPPPPEPEKHKPISTHRYHELPAGIMVQAIGESHTPYAALHIRDLEDPGFLESIVPGLSTYTDHIEPPEMTTDLEQALAHFEKGIRYIYKEGEFEDRDNPFAQGPEQMNMGTAKDGTEHIAIDREGWEPGVLEKILWDRRRGRAERKRWKRAQERARKQQKRRELSDHTDSSNTSSGSSASSSDGDSSSSDSDSSADTSDSTSSSSSEGESERGNVQPTSINKAIGSENIGFKLLSKLGWQQGQGLGAASEGITEPIRPPTRFSSGRTNSSQGRRGGKGRKGKQAVRAVMGGGPEETNNNNNNGDDQFESYRKQMSSSYKKSASASKAPLRHNRGPPDRR